MQEHLANDFLEVIWFEIYSAVLQSQSEADSINILISVDIRKRGCFLVDLYFHFPCFFFQLKFGENRQKFAKGLRLGYVEFPPIENADILARYLFRQLFVSSLSMLIIKWFYYLKVIILLVCIQLKWILCYTLPMLLLRGYFKVESKL